MSPSTVLRDLPLVTPQYSETEADEIKVTEVREVLSEQFLQAFDQTGLGDNLLLEFVFAMDHLAELVRTPNFPNDRLLNTSDIVRYGQEAVSAFNQAVMRTRNKSRLGVAVGPEQATLIEEFLVDRNYPAVIGRVLRALRLPGLNVAIDGQEYFIGLNVVTPHPLFGILSYKELKGNLETAIPFLLDRLES